MHVYVASALTTLDKDCIAEDIEFGMSAIDVAQGHVRAVSTDAMKALELAVLAVCEDIAVAVNDENPNGVQVDAANLWANAKVEQNDDELNEFWVTIYPDYTIAVVIASHEVM